MRLLSGGIAERQGRLAVVAVFVSQGIGLMDGAT